jgi:hypothetical protein
MTRWIFCSFIFVAFVNVLAPGSPAAQRSGIDQVLADQQVCNMPLSKLREKLKAARNTQTQRETQESEKTWACYDPQPGHPTDNDKRAYIERISSYAVKAETKHKVPAAAIAAMALVEAGYGFTRTAMPPTNNLYGWKISAKDRKADGGYVLTCQDTAGEFGDADPNRCYRVFQSEEASVNYVASRLASGFHPNYKLAYDDYQRRAHQGITTIERVQAWLATIAEPYNWKPREYIRTICRLMRDPFAGSDKLNPLTNLYRLSARSNEVLDPELVSAAHRDCAAIPTPAEVAEVRKAQASAYVISAATNSCPVATNDLLGWPRQRLRYCEYNEGGLSGAVYLLTIKPETIATWLNKTCDARMPKQKNCFRIVLQCGKLNSGMMFPVSGNMIENGRNYFFRNGVTVVMKEFPHRGTTQINMDLQRRLIDAENSNISPIPTGLARLWRTMPSHMASLFPSENIPKSMKTADKMPDIDAEQRWLNIVKIEISNALERPDNRLLDAYVSSHFETLSALLDKKSIGENDCPI